MSFEASVLPHVALQDWPPQKHFRDEFPELYTAFMDAVPHPDLSRLDGVLNLAAHFPLNGVCPDLGEISSISVAFAP